MGTCLARYITFRQWVYFFVLEISNCDGKIDMTDDFIIIQYELPNNILSLHLGKIL